MRSKGQEKADRDGDWTDPEIGPQRVTTGLDDFSEVVAGVEPVSLKEGAVEMISTATLFENRMISDGVLFGISEKSLTLHNPVLLKTKPSSWLQG
ncbi:hypothetical protein MO867_08570 [Microbulbifer sp. OS29]|uniref:Uncharacterized protein n=1 Tax=Microbulbifer okhotskensis TaxID=2926617 RepID=A0A9X2J4R4_9GAMM|nr:hypothetical protein [Microbulbifer okhotskensis]MCO1334393.1 hypothetical protein [Microbulbifer okhotskensis]